MDQDTLIILIAVSGGFVAGIVNTLAGNGSAITLSIMTELMGLPPTLANGTNRVGVLMQTISSGFSFIKNEKLDLSSSKWPIIISTLGAIIGVYAAIQVSNEQFQLVFKYLLLFMLVVLLVNPKRWLNKNLHPAKLNHPLSLVFFLLLGFYGGFIQMGMGVVFLIVAVLVLKYNLISANALKTAIVACYTVIAVIMFHFSGLIDWKIGLTIGIGQAIGGYITAEFASKYPKANLWAYVLLIIMVLLAILSSFNILDFTL